MKGTAKILNDTMVLKEYHRKKEGEKRRREKNLGIGFGVRRVAYLKTVVML
jgi:hypothetical protein